jgi:putative tryptophan/tyrosine transport system substrate-binding protein
VVREVEDQLNGGVESTVVPDIGRRVPRRASLCRGAADEHNPGHRCSSRSSCGSICHHQNPARGLRSLGYVDGQTIKFEIRFAGGKREDLPDLARDLVQRKVDVIYAVGAATLRAARDATGTIPIVAIALEIDPVAAGYARTVAQPGGNVTGVFLDQPALAAKWLQLIKAMVPGVSRVAVLRDPTTGPWQVDAAKAMGQQLEIELQVLAVQYATDFDKVLTAATHAGAQALVQLGSPLIDLHAGRIAEVALKQRLPAISPFRAFAVRGRLMSYGPDFKSFHPRPAHYIDKILKGAKPGDLPIEEPEKFELVINLKTAKALGLTIPPSLLLRPDQVIE